MLLTYYSTPELATGLVNLGDLSMVRSMLRKRLVPDKGEFHTFKKPVREGPKGGITTAYHRDRKERLHINKTVIGGPDISTNAKKVFLDITKSNYIPMHICMISLKNSGLRVIPVRIADLRS